MLVVIPNDILKLVTDCGWGVFMQHIKNYKRYKRFVYINYLIEDLSFRLLRYKRSLLSLGATFISVFEYGIKITPRTN